MPAPAHPLIVLRHGQTDWNAARRLQGHEDIPLNAVGRRQAAAYGVALARHLDAAGLDPAALDYVSSPLSRASETMRLVRAGLGLDGEGFRADPRLIELDFGAWSGLALDQIAVVDPDGHAARARDKWSIPPPGGESHAAALPRIAAALTALTGPAVIVTHGGVNRVIKVLLGLMEPAAAADFATPQDRFYVFADGRATWIASDANGRP